MKIRSKAGKVTVLRLVNIVLFLVCLSFGAVSIIMSLKGGSKYSELEKRKLKEFPKLSLSSVKKGSFQKNMEDAFSDHFIRRDDFVSLKTRTEVLSGKRKIGDTYIMKDGTLVEFTGVSENDRKQLEKNTENLSWFVNTAVKAFGKKHVHLMLVPGKESVYLDRLPEKGLEDPEAIVSDKLSEKIKDYDDVVTDLLPDMKKNRKSYIYYRTDHHWTSYGALLAYMSLDQTGFGHLSKEKNGGTQKFSTVSQDFLGTDYNRVHYFRKADRILVPDIKDAEDSKIVIDDSGDKKKTESIYDYDALETSDKYNFFLSGNYSRVTVNTPVKNGETLVIIKDSFANSLVPFLARDYEKIILIDPRYVNSSVLDYMGDEVSDILIVYNASKFMRDTHQSNLR